MAERRGFKDTSDTMTISEIELNFKPTNILKNKLMKTKQLLLVTGIVSAGILIQFFAILAFGFGYEEISRRSDANKFTAPGELVNINEQTKLHLNCKGEGDIPIILDAGLGDFSYSWSLVQPEVSKFAKVCSYDRAGLGFSDPIDSERKIKNIASELIQLLDVKQVKRFIYVAHSKSGLTALKLASEYPDRVLGLVLVDPTTNTEDSYQLSLLTESEQKVFEEKSKQLSGLNINEERKLLEEQSKTQLSVIPLLSRFGVIRLGSSESLTHDSFYDYLPENLKPSYIAQILKQNTIETTLKESIESLNDIEDIYSKDYQFNNLRMTVLSTESFKAFIKDEEYKNEGLELQELTLKIRRESIKDLLKFSMNSKQVIVENSGHYIQIDRPDIVINEIRNLYISLSSL